MVIKQYFPEAFIQLNREITFHPKLQELLAQNPLDFEVRFAVIAAYCDVILDDLYLQTDLIEIADILIQKLRNKRMEIIV